MRKIFNFHKFYAMTNIFFYFLQYEFIKNVE